MSALVSVRIVVNGPPSALTLIRNSSPLANSLALIHTSTVMPVLPVGRMAERRRNAPAAPKRTCGAVGNGSALDSATSPPLCHAPSPDANVSENTSGSLTVSTRTVTGSLLETPSSSVTTSAIV